MIKAILVFNNHGKPRMSRFYQYYVSFSFVSGCVFPILSTHSDTVTVKLTVSYCVSVTVTVIEYHQYHQYDNRIVICHTVFVSYT